jgi:hypothetical protein
LFWSARFGEEAAMYPVHRKPAASFSFDRLDMLWERYPQYHERTTFSTLEALLELLHGSSFLKAACQLADERKRIHDYPDRDENRHSGLLF